MPSTPVFAEWEVDDFLVVSPIMSPSTSPVNRSQADAGSSALTAAAPAIDASAAVAADETSPTAAVAAVAAMPEAPDTIDAQPLASAPAELDINTSDDQQYIPMSTDASVEEDQILVRIGQAVADVSLSVVPLSPLSSEIVHHLLKPGISLFRQRYPASAASATSPANEVYAQAPQQPTASDISVKDDADDVRESCCDRVVRLLCGR